jgi:hypothetical protein
MPWISRVVLLQLPRARGGDESAAYGNARSACACGGERDFEAPERPARVGGEHERAEGGDRLGALVEERPEALDHGHFRCGDFEGRLGA